MKFEEFDREIWSDLRGRFSRAYRIIFARMTSKYVGQLYMGLVWLKNENSIRNGKITDMPLGLLKGIPNFEWIFGGFINWIIMWIMLK